MNHPHKPSPPSTARPEPPQFDNRPLLAAMRSVAGEDSPQNRRALYLSMLQAWFLVPTREMPVLDQPGFHPLNAHTPESFQLEHDSTGVPVIPVFTDEEALRNWNKDLPWIALAGAAFFQAVAATPAEEIVINPFEPADPGSKMVRPGGRLKRCEFEALAQGAVPQEDSQPVLLATPKVMPSHEIFKALIAAAKPIPAVQGMYFSQIMAAQGESHGAVAVEFASDAGDAQEQSALARLEHAVRQQLAVGEDLDFLATSTGLGRAIAGSGIKFYMRD